MTFATVFGAGFLPWAPGTWGSLLAVVAGESLLAAGGLTALAALAIGSSTLGVVAAGRAAEAVGRHDPAEVVVDEVAGQAIALLLLHAALPAGASRPARWALVVLGFALFRLLDIWKPGPVHTLQGLPGGLGIMADDLLAGLLAGLGTAAVALAVTG